MASLSFFARPPPLGVAAPPGPPKRPSSSTPAPPPKRAKFTPEPQHPAMHRVRAPPTPSTSTVAASSSPRRHLSSPHRSKHHFSAPVPVHLDAGTTLVFGRHRRAPAGLSTLPATLRPLLTNPQNLARTIGLDRSARHASRVHAAAELVHTASGAMVRLLVLGQNGVRVVHGGAARRLRSGAAVEFSADEPLNVDFYGAAVLIRTDEEHDHERERLFTPEPAHAIHSPVSMPPSSLPPSSPPVMHMDDESEVEAEAELDEEVKESPAPTPRSVVDLFSRDSSPLSEPEDEPKEAKMPKQAATSAPAPAPAPAPTPNLDTLPAPSPSSAVPAASRQGTPKPKSRAPTPPVELPPFPAALDLPALLASTVVFSGSSKLSLPDLVKALLESQPALRDHGDDKLWGQWAAAELETNPMFGKVARNGKDASGRPLLAHYFYNPAADPDPARAKELGGLVRPLRAAQRTGGKVIDWRPVSSRRRYHY